MSRIGKHPVEIPAGVTVTVNDGIVSGKGKNGGFEFKVAECVSVELFDNKIVFKEVDENGKNIKSYFS